MLTTRTNKGSLSGKRAAERALAVRLAAVLFAGLVAIGSAEAAEYTVKADGSGSFSSIQACANAAGAGDTCLVYGGVYDEHVITASGGTGEDNRLVFRAAGVVTMKGFDIRHPYVTVNGFDITGQTVLGMVVVYPPGNYFQLLNCTIRDGGAKVYGLMLYTSKGLSPSKAVIKGNTFKNHSYMFTNIEGDGHLFENNSFEQLRGADYLRVFGTNHVFRRNRFWKGTSGLGGNHPDFVQTFGQTATTVTQNLLFEENWIADLPAQFSLLKNGYASIATMGGMSPDIKNIIFRRNVIVSLESNANISMPGVQFINNTFFRLAYLQNGMGFGSSLVRGVADQNTLKNNVFLAAGTQADVASDSNTGWYLMTGIALSKETIASPIVTNELATLAGGEPPIATGIFNDLIARGYIDGNGYLKTPAKNLRDISQFVLDPAYATYKQATYDAVIKTVFWDNSVRSSFAADYNYVGGSAASGFAAKRTWECDARGPAYSLFNFCEPHGINGGDPKLANLANPLGPDGVPFTLDDGLKPLPGSPLCGKGEQGADIGAYSCDPSKVLPNQPKPPSNLSIRR